MSKDFTAFDAKLLELIETGCNTMRQLEFDPVLKPMASKLATGPFYEEFRVIDRRLQAARRAGKIRYNGKHWERREI
ncbi:MAG: hypothetical protein ACLGIW_08130 [Gammaproteobacteria bacterium]